MFCFQEKIMNDPCNMVDVNKPHLELLFGLSNITAYISLVGFSYDGNLEKCAHMHKMAVYIYIFIYLHKHRLYRCVCLYISYNYIYTWDYWVALCPKNPFMHFFLIYFMRSFLVFVYRFLYLVDICMYFDINLYASLYSYICTRCTYIDTISLCI